MVHRIEPIRATPVSDRLSRDESDRRGGTDERTTRPFVPTEVVEISDRARRPPSHAARERGRDTGASLGSPDAAEQHASTLRRALVADAALAGTAQGPSSVDRVWNLLHDQA